MKKWFAVLGSVVGVLLLTALVAGTAFAQGPVARGDGERDLSGEGYGRGRGAGYGFVDQDRDGVNDRTASNPEFVDEDGDGLCDVCGGLPGEGEKQENGQGRGFGYGFADEDGARGQRGASLNHRDGANPEFVDEDGDGLCDTHGVARGEGEGAAQGYGRSFRTDGESGQASMNRRSGSGRRAAAQ
jgi:hypothetical protein